MWSEPWVPGFVTGMLALIAAIASGVITGLMAARRERRAHERASASPGAPTVQQVWERQDKIERAFGASLVLLGQAVEQHSDPGKLVFSKAAIKTLRESGYMPPELEDVLQENESN
ncbi:hypothetical protein IXEL_25 [Microbacterium phage Ixel]|nr:hypothetical protein IXEL_25 [Microbacterium phage Ixel]